MFGSALAWSGNAANETMGSVVRQSIIFFWFAFCNA
jgi:hypothetical protein